MVTRQTFFIVILVTLSRISPLLSADSQPFFYYHQSPAVSAPTIVIAHGIIDDYTQAYEYFKDSPLLPKRKNLNGRSLYDREKNPLIAIHFDDGASGPSKYIKASSSSLGQSYEIDRRNDANIAKKTSPYLEHGVSRGASTSINFQAKYNPTEKHILVLESPFDSLQGMIQEYSNNHTVQKYAYKLATLLFRGFREDGEHPIDQIQYIKNKELPILIVCSKQDRIVSWKCSARIYKKFKELGFNNAHILITDTGEHAKILWGPEGDRYQATVEAFKKVYLDEIPDHASIKLLEQHQPSIEKISALLEKK